MSPAGNVLLLPWPALGHLSPMLQFGQRLVAKGLTATIVTTRYINKIADLQADPVAVATISDGFDEGGFYSAANLEEYLRTLVEVGSRTLSELIEERAAAAAPFTCMVYDTFTPWAADVAKRHGLLTVAFSTQSCAVSAIYYYVNKGILEVPKEGEKAAPEGMPEMVRSDFPSFVFDESRKGSQLTMATVALNQFNVKKDDLVLFNSFDELENKVTESLKKYMRVTNIGPCVPLSAASYGVPFTEVADETCMRWLDGNPAGSTVYVSFGSIASLSTAQMSELAAGLEASGKRFLWVVRSEERNKLPPEFLQRPPERGLVVRWCPQLRVLSHPAVGCFLTHCGWNSTLEALSFGVPMVAFGLWSDQPTDAKCVEDVWGVGVRVRTAAETGLVAREEIERCVRAVMEGERSEEMRRNSRRLKDSARKALSKGGSSDTNIDELVAFVNRKAAAAKKHDLFKGILTVVGLSGAIFVLMRGITALRRTVRSGCSY
ncbi:indole-3-acetate beta-glucosyltransferase-like [Canna indica]|uniref:Indole-3-acetate beta-glucosyltransferase-like n=1 Tax=Canna indica TaxID=4628 RepID=A0AAQ3Q5F0_9LILI|nr:indole-3-acetate beta-glucosyltransferase-like [Canna indica]